jgi:hypothetical protein
MVVAEDAIGSTAAVDHVVSVASGEIVPAVVADEHVGEVRAAQLLDGDESVAALSERGSGHEARLDAEVESDEVVASPAVDHVVPAAGEERVDTPVSGQGVPKGAPDETGDVGERVGPLAGGSAGAQIGGHGAGRENERDELDEADPDSAPAPVDAVVTRAGDERVVPGSAAERIVGAEPGDEVVAAEPRDDVAALGSEEVVGALAPDDRRSQAEAGDRLSGGAEARR